jgi:hypothetical protein
MPLDSLELRTSLQRVLVGLIFGLSGGLKDHG